ncbi:tetratricopeptide repeat protein [Lichenicoccus roseus]|uniref:Tetratricopeptide repeat protein n=1 Tax=Lichenicoccus roseus TaxID=2683649 RepID=A0A5R9J8W8_9PROT|nr:tetratricopeptide repeat protein [Lichenicoccus roseus]TLU72021.1 tetratricopeptide repeat protein [Lichenicoccus roseus]
MGADGGAPEQDRHSSLRAGLEALHSGRFDSAAALTAPFATDADIEGRLLHGLALAGCGAVEEAAPLLCRIAEERPQALHPVQDFATLLAARQRGSEAAAMFRAALALTPDEPRLLLAYGEHLAAWHQPDAAETVLERCLHLRPRDLSAMNQLGIVKAALGQTGTALGLFRDVVAINPANHAAWANLGCALANEGFFEDALASYHRAIRLRPNEAQIRLNHSICLLKAGRMTQGWAEHEWRLALPGHTDLPRARMLPNLSEPMDLSGRTVLVTQEEGLGDSLMYLRYVPLLAQRGARVVLWVPEALRRLAARVEGVHEVLSGDVHGIGFDWHCPFISLARAFSGTTQPYGAPVPYLRADRHRIDAMRAQLPPARSGVLRVGLAWGGAPRSHDPVAHGIDLRRSIGLAALAPLAGLEGVQLVSLQKGPYADELASAPEGLQIHDPMPAVEDLDDTAALMMDLDVVVSVDTSVVHLAGALGRPTLLLDRWDNCWRWLHGRDDSPWYPTVSILRQSRPGDWSGVVDRLLPMLELARTASPRGG